MRNGDLAASVAVLREATNLLPRDPKPHRRLAMIYRQANYMDLAAEELEKTTVLSPSDWRSALDLARIYLDVLWLDRAIRLLLRAEKLAPDDPEVLETRVEYWYKRHETAKMEMAARAGLRHHPRDVVMMAALAQAMRLERRFAEAEQIQRKQIASAEGGAAQARGYNALANLLLTGYWPVPRYGEAEQAARLALARDPGNLESHYWLARTLEFQGRPGDAIPHYELVARKNIEFESVAYDLGRLFLRSKYPARQKEGKRLTALYPAEIENSLAFAAARALVRDHPERIDAHRQAAIWYVKSRQYPRAILELRRILQSRPHDSAIRRMMASALAAVGRNTESRSYAT